MANDVAAVVADREGNMELAFDFYGDAIARGDAPLDYYLNLAVLCWETYEYPVILQHKLTESFRARAAHKIFPTLAQAGERFPSHPGPIFWSKFIREIERYDEERLTLETCRGFLKSHPDFLDPVIIVLADTKGDEGRAQGEVLLRRCAVEKTFRANYLTGYISGPDGQLRKLW
jgi:hypothetical protein